MDQGASSSSSSARAQGPAPPTPVTPRRRKREDIVKEPPEDEAEEDERAAEAGSRIYPPPLWNRLKNPPKDRPTVDVWEFKMDGEVLTMTFTCDGAKYPMYFTPRSTPDYTMRVGTWIPRHEMLWASFRTRIYSVPKFTKFNKLIFHNTPDSEAEDCLLEFMFTKRWSARVIDYTVMQEWTQPHHLRKLVHMFKPIDIILHLGFGPYPANAQVDAPHTHLCASYDTTVELEKDLKMACAAALNSENRAHIQAHYAEAARGKLFGVQILRTMCSLRTFVSLMVGGRMAQVKGMNVRRFVVNYSGASHDKICPRMAAIFKDEKPDEVAQKKAAYANGEKVFICLRNEMRRANKYSLSLPATSFKMNFGNEQLLTFTKIVPHFICLFRTSVDEKGILQLATEWFNNQRQFEEIQIHVDHVFEITFLDSLNADTKDHKRIKLHRNLMYQGQRHTLYIDKERLSCRHLHLRVMEKNA